MKRGSLLLWCFCFLLVSANAQIWIGVQSMLTVNSNNPVLSDRSNVRHRPGLGISAGLPVQIELGKRLSIATGVFYLTKNYQFNRIGAYRSIEQYFSNRYIEIPVLCQYIVWPMKHFNISIEGGFFGGYWIYAFTSGKTPNLFNSSDIVDLDGSITQYITLEEYSQQYNFNASKDNRWEFGIASKINLDYIVSNKKKIVVSIGYDYALTNQEQMYQLYQITKSNRSLHISVGLIANIKM